MKTPESYEKDAIKKYLKSIDAFFFSPYMAGFGKSGVPDIVCCIEGWFWGIEIKREGKHATVLQARCMEEIKTAGGLAICGTAEVVIKAIGQWLASQNSRT